MIQPDEPSERSHLIRASLSTYIQYARAAAVPFVAIGLYGIRQLAINPHAPELIAVLLAVVLPIYLLILLQLELSRVGWDDHRVWKIGLTGKRTIKREDIAGVAFRSVSAAMSVQTLDKLVVYGRDKHILLILWGAFWTNDDLRTFANGISPAPANTISQLVSQRAFNREFPTGGSVVGRHPNLSGIVGALLITLLICVGIAATEH